MNKHRFEKLKNILMDMGVDFLIMTPKGGDVVFLIYNEQKKIVFFIKSGTYNDYAIRGTTVKGGWINATFHRVLSIINEYFFENLKKEEWRDFLNLSKFLKKNKIKNEKEKTEYGWMLNIPSSDFPFFCVVQKEQGKTFDFYDLSKSANPEKKDCDLVEVKEFFLTDSRFFSNQN